MSNAPIPNPNSGEPALAVGGVTAVVGAVLALLVAFGLNLTAAQTAAVLGATTALAPLASGWFTRGRVYSPQTVARMLGRNRMGQQ